MDGEANGEGDARERRNLNPPADHNASTPNGDNSQLPGSSASSSSNTANQQDSDSPTSSSTSANSEYCKQLESWLWKCYWHRTLAISAYFTALNQHYGGSTSTSDISGTRTQQQQGRQQMGPGIRINFNVFANQANNQQRTVNGAQLALVKIAPIWKRLLAEVIDFVILMIVKLIVTFSIVDNFDIIDFDNLDLTFQQQDADIRISSLYDLAFTLSSELLILELIHRLIACIVEGYCLSKSGCTPGKSLLNLRVVYAESITSAAGNQAAADVQYALVSPASYLTFPRAFFRSAVKNFSLAFFFPLCFTLFHFDYSRTLYDMLGKSLVVENN